MAASIRWETVDVPTRDSERIDACTEADVEAIVTLWRSTGLTRPWNDPHADLASARAAPSAEVLVLREDGAVVGSVLVGYDGHRGWMYYLAVAPDRQGAGRGRALVKAAERWLTARGCPKVQVMIRRDNAEVVGFYDRVGYEEQDLLVRTRWLDR